MRVLIKSSIRRRGSGNREPRSFPLFKPSQNFSTLPSPQLCILFNTALVSSLLYSHKIFSTNSLQINLKPYRTSDHGRNCSHKSLRILIPSPSCSALDLSIVQKEINQVKFFAFYVEWYSTSTTSSRGTIRITSLGRVELFASIVPERFALHIVEHQMKALYIIDPTLGRKRGRDLLFSAFLPHLSVSEVFLLFARVPPTSH